MTAFIWWQAVLTNKGSSTQFLACCSCAGGSSTLVILHNASRPTVPKFLAKGFCKQFAVSAAARGQPAGDTWLDWYQSSTGAGFPARQAA